MSLVVKNTAYLAGASVLQKLLAFIYFSIIARMLGVEKTGLYTFALSYTALFAMFMDLGLSSVLVREVARDKNKIKTQSLLNTVLGLKLIFGFLILFVVWVSIWFLETDPTTRYLVFLSSLVMFLDSFVLTFWCVFRGWQKLSYEAFSMIGAQGLIMLVGLAGLFLGMPIWILIFAFILGSASQLLFFIYLSKKKLGLFLNFSWDTRAIRSLTLLALPFAFLSIFTKFFHSADLVLLKFLTKGEGARYVGYYSVPYKIHFALNFIPASFGVVIYPAMSRYYVSSRKALKRLFERSLFFLMILGIPCAIGIAVLAPELILKIYGSDYRSSIPALQLLILSLPFVFVTFPVGALLNASNRQKENTRNTGLALVLSVFLNILLIPVWFHMAPAFVSLFSNAFLFLAGLYCCSKIVSIGVKALIWALVRIVFSAMLMGFLVWFLKESVFLSGWKESVFIFLVLPIAGALIYFACLIFFRVLGGKEIEDLKEGLRPASKI